jgi:serine/threonine protein kinase
MAKVTRSEELLDLTYRSGVVDQAQFSRWLVNHPTLPKSAEALAELLVCERILTPFQAKRLLEGRWRNLLINGKLRLLQPLAATGSERIFLCEHALIQRKVVLKAIDYATLPTPDAVNRFNREAAALLSLNHPNLIRALDVDRSDRLLYLVLEYIEGPNLLQLLEARGPLAVGLACNLMVQTCNGLQHAHNAGWVHREINPSNLMLGVDGIVRILNMSLTRMIGAPGENSLRLTLTDQANLLEIDYFAPEQLDDPSQADQRSDLYSVGMTLYHLLAGHKTFGDIPIQEKVARIHSGTLPPITQFRPDVPEKLATTIARLLHPNPNNRYASTGFALADLQPFAYQQLDLGAMKLEQIGHNPYATAAAIPADIGVDSPPPMPLPAPVPKPRGINSILVSGLDLDDTPPERPPLGRVIWVSLLAFGTIGLIGLALAWLQSR